MKAIDTQLSVGRSDHAIAIVLRIVIALLVDD